MDANRARASRGRSDWTQPAAGFNAVCGGSQASWNGIREAGRASYHSSPSRTVRKRGAVAVVSTSDGCTSRVHQRRDHMGTRGGWERRAVHKLGRPHTPHRLASP